MPVARAKSSEKSRHRWRAWAEIPQHFCQQNSLHIVRASSRRCIAQRSNCADRTASFHQKQRQFRWKTGWILWRTYSKNRAEIRKNEFSFLLSSKPTIFFVRVLLQLISKNRGLPRQNRRIICDFSSKKVANAPPETLENTHLIYIYFICQWAFRSTNCIAVLSVKLPHAAAPPLPGKVEKAKGVP